MAQSVMGVESNRGTLVAQIKGPSWAAVLNDSDNLIATYKSSANDDLTAIGRSWKRFDNMQFKWFLADTMSYMIKSVRGPDTIYWLIHRSDAITSAAAFVGISIALIGGPGWEPADDWAALLASAIIAYNGIAALRPAVADLMDRAPGEEMRARVSAAATGVRGVCAIEKLKVRKAGLGYWVDLHVQADPRLPLEEAHVLSGMVKSAIRQAVPEVAGALIHMEPYESGEQ